MAAFCGIPIIGSIFLPVCIGALTIFLLWNFVISKNHSQFSETSIKDISDVSLLNDLQSEKVSKKMKKARGIKKSCCDDRKNKAGCCSTKTGTIESLKVIVNGRTNFVQQLHNILSQTFLETNLGCELLVVSNCNIETLLQKETQGVSLCLFLFDNSPKEDIYLWLERAIESRTFKTKPLSGMKYAVFSIESRQANESTGNVFADQWLHKLGAVRVCKAGKANVADKTYASVSEHFQLWAQELYDRVMKWNEPKNKICKCGPKDDKDACGKESCSGSSSCSDTDANDIEEIDLEDIGTVLNLKRS